MPAARNSATSAARSSKPGVGGSSGRVLAEQTDRAAYVGDGLAPDPLGLTERLDRLGVAPTLFAAVLEVAAGRREVEHRDAQRVSDQVVDLARDPLALLEHRLPLADRVLTGLRLEPELLGADHEADVEGDHHGRRPDGRRGPGQRALDAQADDHRHPGAEDDAATAGTDRPGHMAHHEHQEERCEVVVDR